MATLGEFQFQAILRCERFHNGGGLGSLLVHDLLHCPGTFLMEGVAGVRGLDGVGAGLREGRRKIRDITCDWCRAENG